MISNLMIKKGILRRILIITLLMLWIGSNIPSISAKASSATITFSTSTPEVKKGDSFSVVLTIKSQATIGDFEAYIFYDSDIMEFKTGGSYISGGDGLLRVSDMNTEMTGTEKKYSMKFRAIDVGACEVGISDTAIAYDYDEGSEMSVSSNRLSISVVSSEKLSNNNNLESLKISPGTLNPVFDPKVTEYTTEVTNDTDKIFVSGVSADKNATVSVAGNDKLKQGSNSVVISVKAPSGDVKKYIITVMKDTSATVTPSSSPEPEVDTTTTESGFSIFVKDGITILYQSNQYKLIDLLDETKIPEGYEKTSLNLNGITVDAYALKKNLEHDFILIYAMNQNGNIGFYQYDRLEKTLQRFDGKLPVDSDESIVEDNQEKTNVVKLYLIIAGLIMICISLIVVIIRLLLKLKGHDKYKY